MKVLYLFLPVLIVFNLSVWSQNSLSDRYGTSFTIRGNENPFENETGVVYSIPPIDGAVSYNWTVPNGATIVNGAGTNSIVVDFTTPGKDYVYVSAVNICGTKIQASLSVNICSAPVIAGGITGNATPSAFSTGENYSVSPAPDAISYTWTVPTGATITSGQGTPSVTVDFAVNAQSGDICVSVAGSCATSSPFCLNLTVACPAPPAPVANAATNITLTGFDCNWSPVNGAVGYYLDVADDAGFNNLIISNQSVGNALTHNLAGLICNMTYYYRVRAENSCGSFSGNSNAKMVVIVPSVPLPAPTLNMATNMNATGFDATWSAVPGAADYYLDVSDDAGFSNLIINNQSIGNNTTYNVTGLTCNTTYYFRVRSGDICANPSANSNVETTFTTVCPFACGNPVTFNYKGVSETYNTVLGQNSRCWLDRNLGASQVAVSSTDANAFGDLFQWGRGDDGHQDRAVATTATLSNTDQPGHALFIQGGDWRSGHNDNLWQGLAGINNPCPSGWRIPTDTEWNNERTAWGGNNATGAFNSSLKLTQGGRKYNDGSLNEVNSTGVYWSSTAVGGTDLAKNLFYDGGGASIGQYARGDGNSVRCIEDICANAPTAPTSNAATNITATSFDANWNMVIGATGYYIDVSDDAGFNNLVVNYQNVPGGASTSFTFTGLTCNTTYYYRVKAVNSCGISANSNVTQFTTISPLPLPVAVAANNLTISGFDANWNAVVGATYYELDVSDDAGFSNLIVNNQNVGNVTTYNVSGLNCNTVHYFRVRAGDACGPTANSNVITVTTLWCHPICGGGAMVINSVLNSTTGETWLDRNLGATQVAVSSTDAAAYGDLFQWGRLTDGHQCRSSVTTNTLSITDVPGHSNFIISGNPNNDWRQGHNDNLWQGVNGANNPCPAGYRIPTDAEWIAEYQSWNSQNATGAFNSPLKLTLAGRKWNDGTIHDVTANGHYWSSTVSGADFAKDLYFTNGGVSIVAYGRSDANSVRCIRDCYSAPIAPQTNAATNVGLGSFTANWNISNGAINYYLDVATDAGFNNMVVNNQNVGNVTTFGVNNLSCNTTYYYRVRAANPCGTSAHSSSITVITNAIPVAIAGNNIGDAGFTANWNAVQNATEYYLDVATDNAFSNLLPGYNNLNVGNVTSVAISGLACPNDYYYRVRSNTNCGISASSNTINVALGLPGSQTFSYTGTPITWTVPATCGTITIEVWGAEGGGVGGKGGYSTGELAVSQGETLIIQVGGKGSANQGGWNGGGNGTGNNGGGGGATDVRTAGGTVNDRIIVAGGGGGGGAYGQPQGGYGGGTTGGNGGGISNGDGGTQSVGGHGSYSGDGSFGAGGTSPSYNYSSGGGGGWYGGGDGWSAGGGSGYVSPLLNNAQTISGNTTMPDPNGGTMTGRSGDGFVRISW